MANIKITFKDGTVQDFKHEGRAGGSYTKSLRYEGAFLVITDEYGRETAFPAADVRTVHTTPNRY